MTEQPRSRIRAWIPRFAALALLGLIYPWVALPGVDRTERAQLASRFQFSSAPVPVPVDLPLAKWREVHPTLEPIRAWISAVGAATALADLDGDGLPNDLCMVDPRIDRAYVTPAPGTGDRYPMTILDPHPLPYDEKTMAPMGCVPGDIDEDGRCDVIVYYWGRTPIVFRNVGSERESSYQPLELCASVDRWYTNALTRADVDGDGHLDVIVGNYFPDGARILDANDVTEPQSMQTSMSRAYNSGSERILLFRGARGGDDPAIDFVDTPFEVTPNIPNGWTLAIGAADLTGDLLPEIYVANDFGPDRLLHNQSEPGVLRFALLEGVETPTTPSSCAIGRDSFKGMGVDFADVNGDGLFDIYVSNIAAEYALLECHFLFVSNGDTEGLAEGRAPYRNESEALGVARSSWGWESRLADFDNDGVLEAVQATGFLKGEVDRWAELQELATANDVMLPDPAHWPQFKLGDDLCGHAPNPFFVRTQAGHFVDIAADLGIDEPHVSRGIATADVDGDGDLDFVVANQWEASRFYRNDAPNPGRSLVLDIRHPGQQLNGSARTVVVDPEPTRLIGSYSAVGSHVRCELPDGSIRVAEVDGGNGHSGARAAEIHLGLGDHPSDQPIEIDVTYRNLAGVVRTERLSVLPGRHVILLANEKTVQ